MWDWLRSSEFVIKKKQHNVYIGHTINSEAPTVVRVSFQQRGYVQINYVYKYLPLHVAFHKNPIIESNIWLRTIYQTLGMFVVFQ